MANTTVRREYTPSVQFNWTVPQVRAALAAHEYGDFSMSAQLADWIQRDDMVRTALETRVLSVLGLPFQVEPSRDAPQGRAKRVAAEVWDSEGRKGWWKRHVPKSTLASIVRWGLLMGFGYGQNVWRPIDKKLLPTPQTWHPQFVRWDMVRRAYYAQTEDAGEQLVTAGEGNWWFYSPGGSDRAWMNGLIRSLAMPVMIRYFAYRDEARAGEVAGLVPRKAKVPKDAKPEAIKQFMRAIAALGSETTIKVPEGWDVELMDTVAQTGAAELFENLLDRCDRSITLQLLGQDGTTEAQSGLNAGAGHKVLARTQLDRLEADVESLSDFAREQWLVPYALRNEGDGDLAPIPWWDAAPPEDKQAKATTLNVLADAMTKFKALGVNIKPIAEDYGLELATPDPEDDDEQEQRTEQTPAASGTDGARDATADESEDGGEQPAPILNKATTRVNMADDDKVARQGAVNGQLFTDALADNAGDEIAAALDADVDAVLEAIENGESYADVRARLLEAYKAMDPGRVSKVVTNTLVAAEVAGRASVAEDL